MCMFVYPKYSTTAVHYGDEFRYTKIGLNNYNMKCVIWMKIIADQTNYCLNMRQLLMLAYKNENPITWTVKIITAAIYNILFLFLFYYYLIC